MKHPHVPVARGPVPRVRLTARCSRSARACPSRFTPTARCSRSARACPSRSLASRKPPQRLNALPARRGIFIFRHGEGQALALRMNAFIIPSLARDRPSPYGTKARIHIPPAWRGTGPRPTRLLPTFNSVRRFLLTVCRYCRPSAC